MTPPKHLTQPHPPPLPSLPPRRDETTGPLRFCSLLQNGLRGNSASWQMAAAHVDLDAMRGISSHSICTRHIHSLSTRPNLEAVLLVAMVATVDNTAISLAPSL